MLDQLQRERRGIDRRYLLVMGVLPAVVTIIAMAVGFSLVAGILFVREAVIVGSLLTQVLALAVMYVLPQFVVGLWMGTRYGPAVATPIAAGLAPILVLVVALGAFGGPVLSPFESLGITVAAIVVWALVCTCGLLVGSKLLEPQLKRRTKQTA